MFQIDLDNENRLTHCLWANVTSQIAYSYFCDVIVFDTTYFTNLYDMILAPILGVNNYFHTTIFCDTFLCD